MQRRRRRGPRGAVDTSRIGVSIGGGLPLPLQCPLHSVTLHRRQLFLLLGDDVGMKSGAPATHKARFGQNRVRGGASVKRRRSHRTALYWGRRGAREGGGEGGRLRCIRTRSVYVWHATRCGPFAREPRRRTGACQVRVCRFTSTTFTVTI